MNYNSVEEILSAGTANMTVIRNNSSLTTTSEKITGVSWFNFDGEIASSIYIFRTCAIGFNSRNMSLKVNSRTAATTYYVYREEGTLKNKYRFLKIRCAGYSARTVSDAAKIEYDIILWDTGDISLHMVTIPTSNNNGTYSLITSSATYSYSVSTSSPNVTFLKTDSGFEVNNTIIRFYEQRYLIRSDSVYYTVSNGALTEISDAELVSETFLNYGIDSVPEFSLLTGLFNPEILYWTDGPKPIQELVVKGTPPLPKTIYYEPQNIPEGSTIANIDAVGSDDALFAITFDEGVTWKYYNENVWLDAFSMLDGMTVNILRTISQEAWAEVSASTSYQMRCTLPTKTSYAGSAAIEFA